MEYCKEDDLYRMLVDLWRQLRVAPERWPRLRRLRICQSRSRQDMISCKRNRVLSKLVTNSRWTRVEKGGGGNCLKLIIPVPLSLVKSWSGLAPSFPNPSCGSRNPSIWSRPTEGFPSPTSSRSRPTAGLPSPTTSRSRPTAGLPSPTISRSRPTTSLPSPTSSRSRPN